MSKSVKYNQILDALQHLLEQKDMQTISVSEIAQAAGIGKGSIYYYFSSKEEILEALIKRSYEKPLETAKKLAEQTHVSPFTRMAMIFQACRNSSSEFLKQDAGRPLVNAQEKVLLHQKYLNYLVTELKPVLTLIIEQGIETGELHFDHPGALAEIVLIILAVKFDNSLIPSTPEEIEETILGLISLLEKGTENPSGSLNFLITPL
ncbi:MAG: TetR/AcrR family transcriptional regulator [Lachnospiraceae bacterium]|nr:TetR/AcrR family transcriptional regulator [Lachnospiraceae bacterium]